MVSYTFEGDLHFYGTYQLLELKKNLNTLISVQMSPKGSNH